MAEIKTGGAAFPLHPGIDPSWYPSAGMTLRDYFAAKALQGLLAGQFSDHGHHNLRELPEEAYEIADAMIAAREGGAK